MTTETTTQVICDRCDQRAEVYVRDGEKIELPFRWVNLTRRRPSGAEVPDTMDLCPDCATSFEAWRVASEARS